ncbi:6814_t:CDS:2 [Paraglomus brasilianum]|uniref:6814_t:CDS:1 n=1 Tax=Paraglomus brasilianum TaxID=144538 RepID=A0A9N9CFJ0_9GLOM|nr:6814_t:CDS:2 [Paraglomus brasilianum]
MVKTIRIELTDDIQDEVNKISDESSADSKVYVLFFGTELPSTGQSWCPDCYQAYPHIRNAFDECASNATLIEAPVGTREQWKNNPSHPYKVNQRIALRKIPTLIRWTVPAGKNDRLVESECENDELLKFFLTRD